MAKFLFFPYSNQLGSTIPSISLANMLLKNGHEVIYASNGKYTHVLIQKGFKVIPINEISYIQYRKHVDQNNVDFYQEGLINHLVDMELDVIREINPDIIVTNNRPTLIISAKLAKKKLITIVIPTLSYYYNHRYYVPENHFLNIIYPFGDVNKVMPNSIVKFAFNATMKHWAKNFNRVLRTYQLPPIKDYLSVYEGDITLINQTYGISPFKHLPDTYFYLSQDLASTFGEIHTWANELDEHRKNGKKIIFVSMGSSSLKSYPLVMQSIKELIVHDERFVLVSNHVGLSDEKIQSNRMYLEPFMNSSQILPKVDVVVTHGGVNTMSECIINRKPFIGVPEQGEQMWNLRYAEHLGIGKMVSKFKLEKDHTLLKKAILEVIDGEHYQKTIDQFVKDRMVNQNPNHSLETIYKAIMQCLNHMNQ
ncbi:MAG: glycosyltransferase family 1 protein [Bacteroidetes bacterium]|nr:glycosyltransferase family 1 protein [Bacteroidota bacterium]